MELKPGYKQTEAGVIPEDWDVSPLKGKIAISHGYAFSSQYFADHGLYRLTTPGHFYEDGGFRDLGAKQKYYTGPTPSEYILSGGDMIIAMTEQADGLLGSAALIPDTDSYLHNQRLGRVTPLSLEIEAGYLYYIFNSSEYRLKVRETAAGTKVKHTSPTKLLEIPVQLPPSIEQARITCALSDIDALLMSLEDLISKKRIIKQATMQELLTGKRRLPGFEGEWEVKRLGECVTKLVGGGTPSRSNRRFWGNDYPWATVKDMASRDPYRTQESISTEGLANSSAKLIPSGTLIVSTRMALGRPAIYGVDVAINQDLKAIFLKSEFSPDFAFYWFEHSQALIEELGGGSTVKGVSAAALLSIHFPSISKKEQCAIADALQGMENEIEQLSIKLAKVNQLRQGMMQQLLTGKIRLT